MPIRPLYILGPCSAESRAQVLETARLICEACAGRLFIYRAGAWKPRTNPASFQGVGQEALAWLAEAKRMFGMEIATEVATPEHAEAALNAGINYLWIGARTSANPIAVQAIADRICAIKKENDSLKGLCIKNPVNEDSALWLGNIERLEKTGVPVIAVHRGCGHKPCWAMAHAVRSARPDIPMLLDPSHMSGEASKIPGLLEKIGELSLNGAMIEVHCNPQEALSDSVQQIKPDELSKFLQLIEAPMTTPDSEATELNWLRAEIDETDDMLWKAVATRMDISRRIGEWKKAHHVAPLQPARFQQITERRSAWAAANGMDTEFIKQLLTIIHNESLKQQD